jgi:hypothetical protein
LHNYFYCILYNHIIKLEYWFCCDRPVANPVPEKTQTDCPAGLSEEDAEKETPCLYKEPRRKKRQPGGKAPQKGAAPKSEPEEEEQTGAGLISFGEFATHVKTMLVSQNARHSKCRGERGFLLTINQDSCQISETSITC